MIISVGYRVKSHRGVQFRIWATQVLREYLVKGFAMNDDFLKLPSKELLSHMERFLLKLQSRKQIRSTTSSRKGLFTAFHP